MLLNKVCVLLGGVGKMVVSVIGVLLGLSLIVYMLFF